MPIRMSAAHVENEHALRHAYVYSHRVFPIRSPSPIYHTTVAALPAGSTGITDCPSLRRARITPTELPSCPLASSIRHKRRRLCYLGTQRHHRSRESHTTRGRRAAQPVSRRHLDHFVCKRGHPDREQDR